MTRFEQLILSAAALAALGWAVQAQVVPAPGPPQGMACAYNTAPPTLTNGQAGWVQCDSTGGLITSGGGGGGGGAVTIADGADVAEGATTDAAATAGGTGTQAAKLRLMTTQLDTINTTLGTPFQAGGALAANQSVNVSQINGVTPLMGNGATGTGSHRVTLSNDNTIPTGWPTAANQTIVNTWAGGVLGAMANYGTSPGAVLVPGVNAFVTNANTNGQATMANSSPVVIASNQSAVPVTQSSPYPVGATPITDSDTGTTGATTSTLPGAASVTTYICGFSIRANATATVTGNATVTGTITGTLNFTQWTAPNTGGLGITEMIFAPCVPASATNTSIAVVSAAPGTGGVVSVAVWGYRL